MSFPNYPKYKNSGIEWLLDVPDHWQIMRLRYLAELNPSKTEVSQLSRDTKVSFLPMDAIGDDGTLSLDKEVTIDEVTSGYTYLRDGDVAVAKITPCYENGKGALMKGLLNGIGLGTTELIVVRPLPDKIMGTYLHYLFISPEFRRLGESHMYGAGGQKRVPDAFVRNFATAVPSYSEQILLTAFLDRETQTIDEMVDKQRRLIDLLKEKRRTAISHIVTKGLNPNTPMKPSGLDWIGDVPEHWELARLRFLFNQEKRQGHSSKAILSVYRDYGVLLKESREDNTNKTPEDVSSYQLVCPGDLVINKMKAWQGSLGISDFDGITSPDYIVYAPFHRECSEFLHLLLRSQTMVTIYRSISNGIRPSQWRLEPDLFLNLPVFLPPVAEQRKLVDFIVEQTLRFDELIIEAERVIELLRERRAALISAAVTGKIDVRALHAEAA